MWRLQSYTEIKADGMLNWSGHTINQNHTTGKQSHDSCKSLSYTHFYIQSCIMVSAFFIYIYYILNSLPKSHISQFPQITF